ncbi:hypothetical protein HDC94_000782 [Leifsonia sp. AK011]|uniref:hypothetical protein n=1 Tax=Leifsonia sp. AK011 TaxID=2723075 RepID=UPI0015CA84D4|nr:hypothetical protein [Leifsonia sp. AK011]NYF09626.1 hypothetical protein [Leifsonia sp. AK011]
MSGSRVKETRPVRAEQRSKTVQRKPAEVTGAVPRVDLLPPEVHERRRTAAARSTILLLAVLAVVLVAGGFAFASLLAIQTSSALASEQERTLDLLAQQGEFIEVRQVQARVSASEAAERVALSTEVDWPAIIREVISAQPPGMVLQNVDIVSATPTTAFPQATVPLQGARIASMDVSFASPVAPDIASAVDSIAANVTGVTNIVHVETVENAGIYTSNLVIYFDESVLANAEEVTQ